MYSRRNMLRLQFQYKEKIYLNNQTNCKDCTDRFVGCHSVCSIYINYKKEIDDLRKEKMKYNQTKSDCYETRRAFYKKKH